jgi:HrpA-like RNA helicase
LNEKLKSIEQHLILHTDAPVNNDKVEAIDQEIKLPFVICPLFANLPPQEQMKAFQQMKGQRKIVLSTNIAETSVTIPGIKYVVDCGL